MYTVHWKLHNDRDLYLVDRMTDGSYSHIPVLYCIKTMNLYNERELKLEDLNSCTLALLCQTENLLSRLHKTKQHQDLRQNILCKSSSKKQKQKQIHFIVKQFRKLQVKSQKQFRKLQVKSQNNSGRFRFKVKTIQVASSCIDRTI